MSEDSDKSPLEPQEPSSGKTADERARVRRERAAGEAARARNERLAARLVQQWTQLREERQEQLASPVPIVAAEAPKRASVPYGVDLAAAWGWRFLVIAATGYLIVRALGFLEVIVIPVVIALLVTALVVPIVSALQRLGLGRGIASLLVVIGVILVVAAMLTFAGQQVASGANDLANQASQGLGEIRDWLKTGPFHASDSQIDAWINRAQKGITEWGSRAAGSPLSRVTEVGGVAADAIAGMFIVLFSTFFFLAEGAEIWRWVVRIMPRAARARVDSSGHVAWTSLTQFVRATVIVAAVDAIGVMIVAAILRVPFVAAIGVLVFLGAFIPMIGAVIAGTVAVLVALVDHGIVTALIMLGGVILVQQVEAHGLQPFLMGRWVRVHPLAVILAIATGVLVAGIPGALVAVPFAAALNAVVKHLAAEHALPSGAAEEVTEEGLEEDPETDD